MRLEIALSTSAYPPRTLYVYDHFQNHLARFLPKSSNYRYNTYIDSCLTSYCVSLPSTPRAFRFCVRFSRLCKALLAFANA